MTTEQKTNIQTALKAYVSTFSSQRVAAANLKKVSEATVVQVLSGNWELISDAMWRSVGKQVGWSNKAAWQHVDTRDSRKLMMFIEDSKAYGNTHAIIGATGTGKSYVSELASRRLPNIYILECADYWTKKDFLTELLSKLGKDAGGMTVAVMMETIITSLLRMEEPVIILDEADKLSDHVLYFFITLYNKLRNSCGIILLATEHLEQRIRRGCKLGKKGYAEIYSRVARRFPPLKGASAKEIEAIARANGISNDHELAEIVNDCDGDLRRVERAVLKQKLIAEARHLAFDTSTLRQAQGSSTKAEGSTQADGDNLKKDDV